MLHILVWLKEIVVLFLQRISVFRNSGFQFWSLKNAIVAFNIMHRRVALYIILFLLT